MKIPYLDLKKQYLSLQSEINAKVLGLIRETSFIGGQEVKNFETGFAELYGVNHCVSLGNGTDALYIAMKMLGIGSGDEVITTALSWISTSESISQTGAKPVFVDIDDYYTIDVAQIETKIKPGITKAILPVHLYGQMADMDAINALAQKYDLHVIEDCAQSHFSEYHGQRAGVIGDVGTFSFYPGKNLGAYGDAGALITNNEELASKCKMFANHGALQKHQHVMEGMNSRMDTIQAGVLNVKLPHIINWTKERVRIAQLYLELLKDVEGIGLPLVRENTKHSFHVFAIKTKQRDALKVFLAEKGIDTQIHYPTAMPFMEAYAYQNARPEDYPNALALQNEELSLPIYPEMSDEEVAYVCCSIKEFFLLDACHKE